jgi:hypothetical protein
MLSLAGLGNACFAYRVINRDAAADIGEARTELALLNPIG